MPSAGRARSYRQTAARRRIAATTATRRKARRSLLPATTRDGQLDPDSERRRHVRSRTRAATTRRDRDDGYRVAPRRRRLSRRCGRRPRPDGASTSFRAAERTSSRSSTPTNWRATDAENGFGVTIVARRRRRGHGDGQQGIVYGVDRESLRPVRGADAARPERRWGRPPTTSSPRSARQLPSAASRDARASEIEIDGAPARVRRAAGAALPVTGERRAGDAATRAQMEDGHVLYALFIAPGADYAALDPDLHADDATRCA